MPAIKVVREGPWCYWLNAEAYYRRGSTLA